METPTINELELMPKRFGEIFYESGKPINADRHYSYGDRTVFQHFRKPCDKSLQVCQQYIIYYLNAPIWEMSAQSDGRRIKDLIERARQLQTWKQLEQLVYDDLMKLGLDPF